MREYSDTITLNRNSRGIYSLDTVFGCKTGMDNNSKGCFSDCYSARIAKKYGYDFSKNVKRYFKNENHIKTIVKNINKIPLEFIRVGSNGDPSEDWGHTVDVLNKLKGINKEIVIITRHWNSLTINQLKDLKELNVTINTSISAIDDPLQLKRNLKEYERIKPYVKSILRIVSFEFNEGNKKGFEFSKIQDQLFSKYKMIDTVFRVFKNNELVKDGIIKIKETKFLGSKCYVSKYNKKTYFGGCENCLEKCGINM